MRSRFFSIILLPLAMITINCIFTPEDPQEEEIIVPLPINLMVNNSGIPDWYPSTYVKQESENAIC